MGSSPSKLDPKDAAADRRRQQLEQFGVLVPPIFAVPCRNVPLSPSVYDRLHRTANLSSPNGASCLESLHQSDLSTRLLRDFMKPGVWIDAGSQVRASLSPGTSKDDAAVHGRLQVQHSLDTNNNNNNNNNNMLQLSGGTETFPTLRYRHSFGTWASLVTEANAQGQGWLGVNLFHTLRVASKETTTQTTTKDPLELSVQLGSWLASDRGKKQTQSHQFVKSMTGYAILDFLGATAAVEASLPLGPTRSYLSVNLANDDDDSPPLQLTLQQNSSNNTSSISLAQTLLLDRYQLNPLEDRAPHVRNSLAWAISMERTQDHSAELAVAAAWQINRAVAVKAVCRPNQHLLTTAVLVKRWKQPRITCSVLHRYHWKDATAHASAGIKFVGIGIELETGSVGSQSNSNDYYPRGNSRIGSSRESVPETRASLGDE
jgi:hypothetical protein